MYNCHQIGQIKEIEQLLATENEFHNQPQIQNVTDQSKA